MSTAPIPWLALLSAVAVAAAPAPGERGIPRDEPRPTQREVQGSPPAVPEATPTDPGAPLPPLPPLAESTVRVRRLPLTPVPTLPPSRFNPDPGATLKPGSSAPEDPYFQRYAVPLASRAEQAPLPPDQAMPRSPLERPVFEVVPPSLPSGYGSEPLSETQRLPRIGVRETRFVPTAWRAPEAYPLAEQPAGHAPHTRPITDRWRETGFVSWRRYTSGDTNESPYAHPKPELWHPYRQSLLKGDLPIRGQDLFLNITAASELVTEDRTLPSSRAPRAGGFASLGKIRTHSFVGNLGVQADLFRGETVFRPVAWLVRLKPVFSFTHLRSREDGLVAQVPTAPPLATTLDTSRRETHVALQELYFEKHLRDLSNNYDFCAVRAGNQTFNSDFRGFIFNDTNLGARFFGNYDNNRWQYNVALFDLRAKDPDSELNTLDRRGQLVFVANLYRQDFWQQGYTAQASFHASIAQPDATHPHGVNSYYLGWTGDGHVGRWNVSHAAYVVAGRDGFNGLAGRAVDVFAHMAALEVSHDRDWIRFKGSLFYASGDRDPRDGRATGFDAIVDNANFTGGPFSYYVRQGFKLDGSVAGLKPRFSLFPTLRAVKSSGPANFVNPGIFVVGYGNDLEITPRLRAVFNANYIRFATVAPLRTALRMDHMGPDFGLDLSVGFRWRPLLTSRLVISAGYGALLPGAGLRDLYDAAPLVPAGAAGVPSAPPTPRVDRRLRSALVAATFTH